MSITHAAIGVAAASVTLRVAPHVSTVAALAAIAGGVFPDLDLLLGEHRRSLHYPVAGWAVAVPAAAAAVVAPSRVTVAVAAFLGSAAIHASSDVLGAGHELRPWERTSDRAVYDHVRGRWLRARRLVRYDGAPEDVLLTAVFSIPGLVLYTGIVRFVTVIGVAVAIAYGLVRKRVPPYLEGVVE